MKQYWIEYSDEWRQGPMTFWVHRAADGKPWYRSRQFNPPAPGPVAGRGYATMFVELDGFTFQFASMDEMDCCIDQLAQRHLPFTNDKRDGVGPGAYWQNRLPKSVLSWRYRQKAVKYLNQCRNRFKRLLAEQPSTK